MSCLCLFMSRTCLFCFCLHCPKTILNPRIKAGSGHNGIRLVFMHKVVHLAQNLDIYRCFCSTQRYTFSFYAQSRSSGTKTSHIPLLLLYNHDRLDFCMWILIFLFGQCIAALCILGQCSSILHFVCTACSHEVSLYSV